MNDINKSKEKQKKPLILIAEDIPQNLEVVCNILRKEGYRLAMAGNGRQALEMVPNVVPDLILLDIMMPEMDGFEVCQHLQKDPETKEIPVIFLTAKAETADIVKGFELGAVDYVTKPFKGTELLARVRTHLELKFSREALKELNATKDKFFSIIAHDLKDPLQFLLLAADSLHNNYDNLDESKRKNYIHRFYNNSHLISALLENLLQWARSQTRSLEIKPEKIDIPALAAESINLLEGNAQKKNIRISTQIAPGTFAFGDKNMIRTVLRNLISNGVKFTPPGGEVIVNAAISAKDNRVEVTVTDNGIGMDAQYVDGLFRIDVKQNIPGTAKERGTGLGLILCKEFLEKNNGSIEVSSEPGKGSCFTFTLPAGVL
ncbi:MAG: response regulator [Candidatus Aminicenantes bacterium]|nr:response regulator [Candidatus Aminicenantes bacterium]NIM79648.1 response regulator [Candidatus Aminicenantes bacterium]NIN18974.1 response regulator [Candidatus Aminicenantes bacterium]NIN42876.1 response regulator [Candidatus Aminicenantes bacterium]NIN85613.1 response regulator [Candidatus Aminicenantes bacterium]